MKRLHAWLEGGAYEKERTYISIGLSLVVFVVGMFLLGRIALSGAGHADKQATARLQTVVAVANLHDELTGRYPDATTLRFLLADDGFRARIGSCRQTKTAARSSTLYVDRHSSAGQIIVHTQNSDGTVITLAANDKGEQQIAALDCSDADRADPVATRPLGRR